MSKAMMRSFFGTVCLCAAISLAGAARAEEFTGFYAGMNAGYAFGGDRSPRGADPFAPSSKADSEDRALPPSALQASEVMKGSRPRAAPALTAR